MIKNSEITVYTCSINNRDPLRLDQCTTGALFLAYVDFPAQQEVWHTRPAGNEHRSARRNARMHKALSHQYTGTQYSVWMDSNVSLLVPASRLVEEYLVDADLAVFRHRARDCSFAEAATCIQQRLDDPVTITNQIRRYREAGLQEQYGLPETSVLIRRHSPEVVMFNKFWWQEILCYSVRDQISFTYAARQAGLAVNMFEPTKFHHPYFSMTVRPAGAEAGLHAVA